jgi:hypothetical protein
LSSSKTLFVQTKLVFYSYVMQHAAALFEKSAGALGTAGPRWDPFVNARALADLVKLSKGDGLGARGTQRARWT